MEKFEDNFLKVGKFDDFWKRKNLDDFWKIKSWNNLLRRKCEKGNCLKSKIENENFERRKFREQFLRLTNSLEGKI
jgi:hypothetical protein